MTDTNVLQFSQPGTFADPLTEVLRNRARVLLAQTVEAEVASLLERYADEITDDGRRRLVRHGYLPGREIVTGIGPVAVRCPGVRAGRKVCDLRLNRARGGYFFLPFRFVSVRIDFFSPYVASARSYAGSRPPGNLPARVSKRSF